MRYGVPWAQNANASGAPAPPVPTFFNTEVVIGPVVNHPIPAGTLELVNTGPGAVSLVPPASGTVPVGTFFGVADTNANAAVTPITIGGLSIHIEDPQNPGQYASSVEIVNPSQTVWWVWSPIPGDGTVHGWKIWAEGYPSDGANEGLISVPFVGNAVFLSTQQIPTGYLVDRVAINVAASAGAGTVSVGDTTTATLLVNAQATPTVDVVDFPMVTPWSNGGVVKVTSTDAGLIGTVYVWYKAVQT